MCEYLEAVTAGQIRRLIINVPPRYMKSITVTIMWPAWEWIRSPGTRWMFASYSGDLSREHSVARRTIIQSPWYQEAWADAYQLTGDQNVKTEYRNTKQGVMLATSIGGTATGKGANRLVIDDPHNPRQADSDQVRESQVKFFDQSLYSRLNDKKRDAIVVVMQRLAEKDLTGHLLAGAAGDDADKYEHLCLPAEAERKTVVTTPAGNTFAREAGDLLWEEREGARELAGAKKRLGPYGYAGQYQQTPVPAGGGRFKREWFRYWRHPSTDESLEFYELLQGDGTSRFVRIDACDRFVIIDPAGTDKQQNEKACYTVIQVWDVTPEGDMVLVDQWREQKETPEVEDAAVSIVRRYEAAYLGVEIDGLGLGVIQHVRKRGVAVRGIKAKGSKEARSETAEIRTYNGAVYFPHGAPFLFDLEHELTQFPRSEHKDQVDAFAHAAIIVQRKWGSVVGERDAEAHQYQQHRGEQRRQDAAEAEQRHESEELRRYREEIRDSLDDDFDA